MKTFTEEEVIQMMDKAGRHGRLTADEEGEIIIRTGFFRWKDGSVRNRGEDPNFEKMEEARTELIAAAIAWNQAPAIGDDVDDYRLANAVSAYEKLRNS